MSDTFITIMTIILKAIVHDKELTDMHNPGLNSAHAYKSYITHMNSFNGFNACLNCEHWDRNFLLCCFCMLLNEVWSYSLLEVSKCSCDMNNNN